jgi:hypothetical protein
MKTLKGSKSYRCTLSLTSVLDGVGGQRNAPAALPPGKRVIMQEAELDPGTVWMRAENLANTRIRTLDREHRSKSLHQLRYPGLR